MSLLEKVSDHTGNRDSKRKLAAGADEPVSKRKKDIDDDKAKTKPVALVPPRMHASADVFCEAVQPGKRSKQKKKNKDVCTPPLHGPEKSEDSTQISNQRHSFPPDMASRFFDRDYPINSPHVPRFMPDDRAYAVYRSSLRYYPQNPDHISTHSYKPENRPSFDRYPSLDTYNQDLPRPEARGYYFDHELNRAYSQGNSAFYNATRSLLEMNNGDGHSIAKMSSNSSESLNSSFPQQVSSTAPFWQQYANLAKSFTSKDASAASIAFSESKQSDGSCTDTASISSQEELATHDSLKSPSSSKRRRPSSTHSLPVTKSERSFKGPLKSSTPNAGGMSGKIKKGSSDPDSKVNSIKQQPGPTDFAHALKKPPPFKAEASTKHYFTQSAISSFPHFAKKAGVQGSSINAALASQKLTEDKVAEMGQLKSTPHQSPKSSSTMNPILTSNEQGLATTNESNDVVASKSVLKDTLGVSTAQSATDYNVLKQLGKQIALKNGTMRTKVLLSDLSLPISPKLFSPPIMTYKQIMHVPSSDKDKTLAMAAQTKKTIVLGTASVAGQAKGSTGYEASAKGTAATVDHSQRHIGSAALQTWDSKPPVPSTFKMSSDSIVSKSDGQSLSNVTIYKPGRASVAKSSRKPKASTKFAAAAKKSESVTKTMTSAKLAGRQDVANANDRMVYRNSVMTILPAHPRLVVVPTVTSCPSVASSDAAPSTVLYISSKNQGQRGHCPIVASSNNVIDGKEPTPSTSAASK